MVTLNEPQLLFLLVLNSEYHNKTNKLFDQPTGEEITYLINNDLIIIEEVGINTYVYITKTGKEAIKYALIGVNKYYNR